MVRSACRSGNGCRYPIRSGQWPQEAVVQLGEEDGDALPVGGQGVGVAAGQSGDETLHPQPA